jgi:hypothetical protein
LQLRGSHASVCVCVCGGGGVVYPCVRAWAGRPINWGSGPPEGAGRRRARARTRCVCVCVGVGVCGCVRARACAGGLPRRRCAKTHPAAPRGYVDLDGLHRPPGCTRDRRRSPGRDGRRNSIEVALCVHACALTRAAGTAPAAIGVWLGIWDHPPTSSSGGAPRCMVLWFLVAFSLQWGAVAWWIGILPAHAWYICVCGCKLGCNGACVPVCVRACARAREQPGLLRLLVVCGKGRGLPTHQQQPGRSAMHCAALCGGSCSLVGREWVGQTHLCFRACVCKRVRVCARALAAAAAAAAAGDVEHGFDWPPTSSR